MNIGGERFGPGKEKRAAVSPVGSDRYHEGVTMRAWPRLNLI